MPSREELAYAELMNLESQGPQLRSRTPQKSKFQIKSWAVFGKCFVTEIFWAECSHIFCWKMLFITLTENSMGLSYSRGNSGSSEEIPVNRLQRRANTFFRICASETGRIMPRAHTERENVCEMMIRDYFLASIICHDQGYENDAQNTWQVSTVAEARHCCYTSHFLPVLFNDGRTQPQLWQQPLQNFHWERWSFALSPFGITHTTARLDRVPDL